ncbi:MAG: S9 family peptidase [Planctomycetia bacterium]|nr:S9 family peptidase [Planctomycetia bacterium]
MRFCVYLIALQLGSLAYSQEAPQPPTAKTKSKEVQINGDKFTDNYFYLREKTNPDVVSYLEKENAYTETMMKSTEALQQKLYKEFLGRIKQTDLSVPSFSNGYWYYSRTEEGKQYSIICRKKGAKENAEEIMLDVNELAKPFKFFSVAAQSVSNDNRYLAYTFDTTGFREYTLAIKDLETGKLLPDTIKKVNSPTWSADGKYLFYTTEDHAKRSYRLYRHEVGQSDGQKDVLLYEEKDELFRIMVTRTLDRKYLVLMIGSSESSEMRILPSDQPTGEWKIVRPREEKHRYQIVGHRNGEFFIKTNQNAKNFKLVKCSDTQTGNWSDVIPHRADVLLESITIFKNYMVVEEKTNGLDRFSVRDLNSGDTHQIEMKEPTYTLSGAGNPEFDSRTFRYMYTSYTTPMSVYDYDLAKREQTLLKRQDVLGGYDQDQYQSERVWVTARDGVKVPISLVYKKGTKLDGTAPCLLYGYGSYGLGMSATFSPARLSLLDRGFVYATAHIRGGNEMGEAWHDDGKMLKKKNTFFDFIDCGNWLCDKKYTAHNKLAIMGGSAGGLLVGATLNLAEPGFCKAAVLEVPFVDVINTMMDETLPLTVGEFLEWGNPKNKEHYEYMKSYCPYTNLSQRTYPAMLIRTSLNDSQVMYWEPAKYVAKLRTLKQGSEPLLFKCNMAAGHGGASGRYDALKEQVFAFAFIMKQMGISE